MRSNKSGGMKSLQQEEIGAALDAVDAGYARLRAACSDSVGNAFRVEVAERLERQHRINRGLMYRVFGELIEPPDGPDDPALPAGTVISKLLWQRLRITTGDIEHRFSCAARIRPRRCLTGPSTAARTAPSWPRPSRTATSTRATSTRSARASTNCPRPAHKKDIAERILVRHSKEQDSAFVAKLARDIAEELNPDTVFDEQDRRRRSGLTLGPQRADGLSYLRGWVDPETRAYIEAIQAASGPAATRPTHPPPTGR